MTYFEFYNLPVRFSIDKSKLKQYFFELSKKFHPDFYVNESEEMREQVLIQSTLNNNAYKTLNNDENRLRYVLLVTGILSESEKEILPQDFLMEMMDLNEAIMEMDKDSKITITSRVDELETRLNEAMAANCKSYDETENRIILQEIKTDYLKHKYLLRIKESMLKFAAL